MTCSRTTALQAFSAENYEASEFTVQDLHAAMRHGRSLRSRAIRHLLGSGQSMLRSLLRAGVEGPKQTLNV